MSIDGLIHRLMNAFRIGDVTAAQSILPSIGERSKSKSLIEIMHLIWHTQQLHGQKQIINLLHAHNIHVYNYNKPDHLA